MAVNTKRLVKLLLLLTLLLVISYCLTLRYTIKLEPESFKTEPIPESQAQITRPNAAILYLIIDREEDNFRRSIQLLHNNFNSKHKYPVIAFHETYYPRKQLATLKQDLTQIEPLLQFEEIVFNFPAHYPKDTKPFINYGYPGYNYMIHWWFKDVLDHPLVQGLDYYFRLDTDSFIHSSVNFDPFMYMATKNLKYAYRTTTVRDVASVCQGMVDVVANFIDKHPISKAVSKVNNLEVPPPEERQKYAPFMMYTNFEILHVPTFKNQAAKEVLQYQGVTVDTEVRNQEMTDFVKTVDMTNKIFTLRWGDAPLRYFQVKMFLLPDIEVWEFCSVKYEHEHHNLVFDACNNDQALS